MEKIILIISIIICIIFIIYFLIKYIKARTDKFSIDKNILIPSSVDGIKYYVHSGHTNLISAADMFYNINKDITDYLTNLYEKYKNSSNENKKRVSTLMFERYDTKALRESSPLNSEKDTSFTINKGDIIAICIRDITTYGIQDYNTIMFVVLHELTHLAVEAYDHPPEFWEVFKFVLVEASLYEIYTPVDYIKYPADYCGIEINYTPLLDATIIDI